MKELKASEYAVRLIVLFFYKFDLRKGDISSPTVKKKANF